MLRLYHNSSINGQTVSDLEFMYPLISNPKIQLQIVSRLLNLGLVELCQHICYVKLFNEKLFDETNGELSVGTTAVSACLDCVVKLAEISIDACRRIIDIGLHKDIFSFLNLDSMDPSKVKLYDIRSRFANSAMSVAYNVIQARQQFLFSFFYLLSFPRLISAVGDWMSTILPNVVWPQCEFRMHVWNVLRS